LIKKILSASALLALAATTAAQAANPATASLPISVVISSTCTVTSSGGFSGFSTSPAPGAYTGGVGVGATATALLNYNNACRTAGLTSLTLTDTNGSASAGFVLANAANTLPYYITETSVSNSPSGEQFSNSSSPTTSPGFLNSTAYDFASGVVNTASATALTATLGSGTLVAGTYSDQVNVAVAFV
jgi:hypothetical protein